MATITESLSERFRGTVDRRFNWHYWVQDNITGSWLLNSLGDHSGSGHTGLTIRQLGAYPGGNDGHIGRLVNRHSADSI